MYTRGFILVAVLAVGTPVWSKDLFAIPASSKIATVGARALYESDGYALVNLRGGEPKIFPVGGPRTDKERAVHGRVIDRAGKPVTGAIVFSDRGVSLRLDTLMTLTATVSDANGAYTLTHAPASECVVFALAGDDWSGLVPCGAQVDVPVVGHGAVAARITYDGMPETFEVHIGTRDKRIGLTYLTGADGRLAIPSLPPGDYVASVGLAQSFGGGASKTATRELSITDGGIARLELELAGGTTVVLAAKPPKGAAPKGITYWLFAGAAPHDGIEARVRQRAEDAPSMTVGGGIALDPVQLHDIAPGKYWACAAFFDASTMAAAATPFGCKQVAVTAGESVRELGFAMH